MKQSLEDRVVQIVTEVSDGEFPTYNQLRVMLKGEGYSSQEVDKWFATQAAEFLDGVETSNIKRLMRNDVYLVLDQESKTPLAFWTEGQTGVLPLDTSNPVSWRAANELRHTLKTEGFVQNR
ncbi:MAG TPA: hypothetical protein VFF14_08440 [Candidatus Deferrimicrobium sp.]|nr:hypothetical protein [Candidatus Deferrimicrobium sp.]